MHYQKSHPILMFKVILKDLLSCVWGWIGIIIAMGEQILGTSLPERKWHEFHRP